MCLRGFDGGSFSCLVLLLPNLTILDLPDNSMVEKARKGHENARLLKIFTVYPCIFNGPLKFKRDPY